MYSVYTVISRSIECIAVDCVPIQELSAAGSSPLSAGFRFGGFPGR